MSYEFYKNILKMEKSYQDKKTNYAVRTTKKE